MSEGNDLINWVSPSGMPVPDDTLLMQMDVYEESILLRGFDKDANWVRMVSADELTAVFTQHLGFSSGLLPRDTLWWKQTDTGFVVALWREPQVWPVALQETAFQAPTRLKLPMPGLVFICAPQRSPWVFAAKERPEHPDQELFCSPTFNTFDDGRVCPGTHQFPGEVGLIPESFFQSYFSLTGDTLNRSQKHPENLLELWKEINGQEEYPVDDLVATITVDTAMDLPKAGYHQFQ